MKVKDDLEKLIDATKIFKINENDNFILNYFKRLINTLTLWFYFVFVLSGILFFMFLPIIFMCFLGHKLYLILI